MNNDILFQVFCSKDVCDQVRSVFLKFNVEANDIIKNEAPRGYDATVRNIDVDKAFKIYAELDKIAGIYNKDMSPIIQNH